MNVVLFALTAMISTAAGGLFALRFRDHMHLILGFTAGVLLGVVAFDILPEIFALADEYALEPTSAMIAMVVGFLLFHSIEKLTVIHHAQEESYADHRHPQVGLLSALAHFLPSIRVHVRKLKRQASHSWRWPGSVRVTRLRPQSI